MLNLKAWQGTLAYMVLGFVIAYGFNIALGLALQTNTPVVAVYSNSMDPTFTKGDMIIVTGEKDIQVGDIIVFDTPYFQYPIIHRIIGISGNMLKTKGDNNPSEDPWEIPRTSVHGKAILKVPALGWIKITSFSILGLA